MTTRPFARTITYLLLPFTLVFAGVAGCTEGGTETGNPSFDAKLSYTAYSYDSTVATVRVPNTEGGAVVKSVWLGLGEVTFQTCDPSAKDNPHAPAIGVGNHAAGAHVFTDFELLSSDYCSIDLPFVHGGDVTLPAEAPATMKDHSIVVEGEAPDGTPFTIVTDPKYAVTLTSGSLGVSIPLHENTPDLLLTFNVGIWLRNVDWASATVTNGTIEISESANPALLSSFLSLFQSGINLYVDEDGDGVVDASPKIVAGAGYE